MAAMGNTGNTSFGHAISIVAKEPSAGCPQAVSNKTEAGFYAKSCLANSSGLNGKRSVIFSPTPINLIGILKWS